MARHSEFTTYTINNFQVASVLGGVLSLMALVGCDRLSQSSPTDASTPATEAQPVVLYDEWPSNGFPNDAATITATSLEKNILTIKVNYQGGCQEHQFKLYAGTFFQQSLPPKGLLHLSHDSQGDTCGETVEQSLMFDLTPLNKERNHPTEHPLLLTIYEPTGGAFAGEPFRPFIEWP